MLCNHIHNASCSNLCTAVAVYCCNVPKRHQQAMLCVCLWLPKSHEIISVVQMSDGKEFCEI